MKRASRRSKQSSPIDDASASAEKEKQVYEERIRELERQNKEYQMEIAELKQQQGNDSSASNNAVEKLKKDYLQKLNLLEEQVTELKKKLDSQSQFSTQRKRVDEPTRQLQFEIQSLKAQKVQLQCKMKLESVQFRLCKALLEKEVLQLKKERRKNEIRIHNFLGLNERLKRVLQRKTEEAFYATKRLREMIEARKDISHRSDGARNRSNQIIQNAEHELEITTQLNELCTQYEFQMEKMSEEIAKLKEENEMQKQEISRSQLPEEESDNQEKDFDIQDLKEQMNSLGSLLRELQLRKEKLDPKDKKQVLGQSLFCGESNRKPKLKPDIPETKSSSENINGKRDRSAEGLCCSCSKKSLCKTTKCKCRSIGGSCGPSCGCTHNKCTNRETNQMEGSESLKSEKSKDSCTVDSSTVDEVASECAKLLQSALVQKPASCKDNQGPIKKPLCDIQNSLLGKLDGQKQGKKKKAKKPVIHLVTNVPISLENSSSSSSTEQSNSGQPNQLEAAISEAVGLRQSRNPPRLAKTLAAKENCYNEI